MNQNHQHSEDAFARLDRAKEQTANPAEISLQGRKACERCGRFFQVIPYGQDDIEPYGDDFPYEPICRDCRSDFANLKTANSPKKHIPRTQCLYCEKPTIRPGFLWCHDCQHDQQVRDIHRLLRIDLPNSSEQMALNFFQRLPVWKSEMKRLYRTLEALEGLLNDDSDLF